MLAGCGSDEAPETTPPPRDTPAEVANDAPAPEKRKLSAAELKQAIGVVVLGEGDIGHSVEVQDQDDTLEAPTNDVCAKEWPGDANRIARNQDFFWKPAQVANLVVSNEAVAYKPGKGAAALAEIKKAVSDCDGWEHEEGEMGDVEVIDAPAGSLKGTFAWQGRDERADGTDYSYVAVYQSDGDLLSALYVWSTDDDDSKALARELAPKAAARLERATG